MREILFRGKRIDDGETVEGLYIFDGFKRYIVKFYTDENAFGTLYPVDETFEVIPETVGQYTGLKDMNGKRIFERDVINRFWLGAEIVYCVQYDGESARFIGKAMNKRGFTTFDGDGEMFEIIGNIHDNPELLEDSNA